MSCLPRFKSFAGATHTFEVRSNCTVTIDRETHLLPETFTVFATQNPIEYEGTYPLPEAQKDRFLLKITMAAPDREQYWRARTEEAARYAEVRQDRSS